MTEKLYRCVKAFSIPKYDEDESVIENEFIKVPLNSTWEWEEESYSTSDLRLENGLNWLDISRETLASYFEEVLTQSD